MTSRIREALLEGGIENLDKTIQSVEEHIRAQENRLVSLKFDRYHLKAQLERLRKEAKHEEDAR